jgi:carboxylesterase
MAHVVLIHGIGGTAATMRPLADVLGAAGHTVTVPTLPGHGAAPEQLVGTTWRDWLDAVTSAVAPGTVLVGQSLGAALAFAAAAEASGVAGVAAINPPAPDPDAVDGLEWRRDRGTAWIDVAPSTVGEEALERLPIEALLELWTGVTALDLAAVRCPVLLVTSRHDDVIDPASSEVIARSLGGPVERLVLERSSHVASLDVERDLLAVALVDFVARAS